MKKKAVSQGEFEGIPKKRGRKPLKGAAMTNKELQQRFREERGKFGIVRFEFWASLAYRDQIKEMCENLEINRNQLFENMLVDWKRKIDLGKITRDDFITDN